MGLMRDPECAYSRSDRNDVGWPGSKERGEGGEPGGVSEWLGKGGVAGDKGGVREGGVEGGQSNNREERRETLCKGVEKFCNAATLCDGIVGGDGGGVSEGVCGSLKSCVVWLTSAFKGEVSILFLYPLMNALKNSAASMQSAMLLERD
jgi:hypothetical protein